MTMTSLRHTADALTFDEHFVDQGYRLLSEGG
jgi:hypothetical protein